MKRSATWISLGLLVLGGQAFADDAADHGNRLDRRGDRVEQRLDRKGDRIEGRLDAKNQFRLPF